jgi:nucleoside-diphosphate-sugar epimerase
MAIGGTPTVFVTEAGGFIGAELLKLLVARGHQVFGLAGSPQATQRVRRAGAIPVAGDLMTPGQWQDEAASADCVFHLPPHPFNGFRMSSNHAERITRARVSMDTHLLDAVGAGATRRIVYAADASCYGATTDRAITEDAPLRPSAWGQCFMPALDRVDGYIAAGLPIVTAFPGWVYGNGSWFCERIVKPVTAGRRVLEFGKPGPWISPIHVHDCARALIHLAERGEVSGRYFLVGSAPVRTLDFATTFARLANHPLRVWRVPAALTRLVAGPVLADHVQTNGVFSNIRLRGIGFQFVYPTIEQGIQEVLGALHD